MQFDSLLVNVMYNFDFLPRGKKVHRAWNSFIEVAPI